MNSHQCKTYFQYHLPPVISIFMTDFGFMNTEYLHICTLCYTALSYVRNRHQHKHTQTLNPLYIWRIEQQVKTLLAHMSLVFVFPHIVCHKFLVQHLEY